MGMEFRGLEVWGLVGTESTGLHSVPRFCSFWEGPLSIVLCATELLGGLQVVGLQRSRRAGNLLQQKAQARRVASIFLDRIYLYVFQYCQKLEIFYTSAQPTKSELPANLYLLIVIAFRVLLRSIVQKS